MSEGTLNFLSLIKGYESLTQQLSVITWKKNCHGKLDSGSNYKNFVFHQLDNTYLYFMSGM